MFEREPEEHEIAPELAAIERQLARLTAAAPRIDRDQLMFEAGRASVARPERPGYIAEPSRLGRYFWPAATSTMTAAALLLATMLVDVRHALQVAQNSQPAIVPVQPASQPLVAAPSPARPEPKSARWLATRVPQSGYLGTRYVALTRGVGAIDTPLESANDNFKPTAQPPTRREMLNELLPSTRAMNHKS